MTLSAWLMMGFGCLVLYGGLTVCLLIALKNRPRDWDEELEQLTR